jgi:hypothetical protein
MNRLDFFALSSVASCAVTRSTIAKTCNNADLHNLNAGPAEFPSGLFRAGKEREFSHGF